MYPPFYSFLAFIVFNSYTATFFIFVSVYPLPLVMRYRYMPLATTAPVMLVGFHVRQWQQVIMHRRAAGP